MEAEQVQLENKSKFHTAVSNHAMKNKNLLARNGKNKSGVTRNREDSNASDVMNTFSGKSLGSVGEGSSRANSDAPPAEPASSGKHHSGVYSRGSSLAEDSRCQLVGAEYELELEGSGDQADGEVETPSSGANRGVNFTGGSGAPIIPHSGNLTPAEKNKLFFSRMREVNHLASLHHLLSPVIILTLPTGGRQHQAVCSPDESRPRSVRGGGGAGSC